MKNFLILLQLIICLCQLAPAQSFLKQYSVIVNPSTPVSFECISAKQDANGYFYIGGHIRDTLAVFKMDVNGNLVNTYRIISTPSNARLDGIMLDRAGNIVVIGNYEFNTVSTQAFIFKMTTAGSIIWYRETAKKDDLAFTDFTDYTNGNYIVSGQKYGGSVVGITGILMRVASATGALTLITNYKVFGTETAESISLDALNIYVAGRYAAGGSFLKFRPAMSRFTLPGVHISSNYFILSAAQDGQLYASDHLLDNTDAVIIGHGDDNNSINPNIFQALQVSRVNKITGAIVFSKKYDNVSKKYGGALSEIRFDARLNYTTMGFLYDSVHGTLDSAFLMSLDAAGNVLWSRSYPFFRRSTVVGFNNQYGFAIFGKYIFAVGQTIQATSALTRGTLLKVDATNGTVGNAGTGAACYQNLNYAVSNYNVSLPLVPVFPALTFKQKVLVKQVSFWDLNPSFICGGCGMTVNAGPDINSCCLSSGVQLNATVTNGAAPFTYSWFPAAGLSNPNIANPVATQVGTYTVTVTDAAGCTASDVVVVTQNGNNCCLIGGNRKQIQSIGATVYPNPSSNNFTLKVANSLTADIYVYDVPGNLMETRKNVSGSITIGNNYQQGVYTARIVYKDGRYEIIKLIKNTK